MFFLLLFLFSLFLFLLLSSINVYHEGFKKDMIVDNSANFVGLAWWNPQILIAYPQSIALYPHSKSSLLYHPALNLTLLPQSSVKSAGYLTKNFLKIAWFPTECPQAPLAPLAAFSRSAWASLEPTVSVTHSVGVVKSGKHGNHSHTYRHYPHKPKSVRLG